MMTSKVTLVGPLGCRPIMLKGSTAPIVYPRMSSVKQLAIWNSSSSAKFNPGTFFSVNSIPWQSFELPMRTDNGNFLRQLYGATFFTYEARCNLASPTCRKPRQEGRDPLTRSTPMWRREWGRLVTNIGQSVQ